MRQFILFLSTLSLSFSSGALIYGTDDREDVYTLPRAERLAQSTATMVSQAFILPQPQGTFNFDFYNGDYQYGLNLCKEERFSQQPSGWLNCSGFLVAEDILVTAGHCMIYSHSGKDGLIENDVPKSTMCEGFNWVFDFTQKDANTSAKISDVSSENIYSCKKVLYAELTANANGAPQGSGEYGRDFAIIQLDRKVVGRHPLSLSADMPKVFQSVMAVGYPSALPAKYAPGNVLPGSYLNYFLSDLDIMDGNSGSAVLNSQDQVVGIVVRGYPAEDYEYLADRSCNKNIICTKIGEGDCKATNPNEGIGTHVQKASSILEKLKALGVVL